MILIRVDGLSDDAQLVLQVACHHRRLGAARPAAARPRPSTTSALESALAEAIDRQLLVVDAGESRLPVPSQPAAAKPCTDRCCRASGPGCTRQVACGPRSPTPRSARPSLVTGRPSWPCTGSRPVSGRSALTESLVAADAATRRVGAPRRSLVHLERALAALDRLPAGADPGVDRRRLLERTADAAYWAGESQRSVDLVAAGDRTGRCRQATRWAWPAATCSSVGTPGPSATPTPPSRPTGAPRRSCRPIHRPRCWPRCWPRRRAG